MKKVFSIFAAVLFASSMMAVEVTVTKTVHDLYPDDANGTKEVHLYNDGALAIYVNEAGNNGKIYETGTEWRLYQTNSATVTVTVKKGIIKTVSFNYGVANTGTLTFNNANLASDQVAKVKAQTAIFPVGNTTDGVTNGQVKIKGFTVVYDPDGIAADDYCQVISTGVPPFVASHLTPVENDTKVSLYLTTDPEWINENTPPTDGASFSLIFSPKSKDVKDIRGTYDIGSDDVTYAAAVSKDGGEPIYMPIQSGSFTILFNKTADAYNLTYNFLINNTSCSGTVNGICADEIALYEHCPITSDYGWTWTESIHSYNDGMVTILLENNLNWLPYVNTPLTSTIGMEDGSSMVFGLPCQNRADLRGTYTDLQAMCLMYLDGEPRSMLGTLETVVVTLNANNESYDIYYKGSLKINENESFPVEDNVYGLCDDELNLNTAIEAAPAVKVNGNKVLRDGHLFIEHEGRLYNATGAQVK